MTRLRYGFAVAVTTAAATLSPAATVTATAAAPAEEHCTSSLDTGAVSCFDTYADALGTLQEPGSGDRDLKAGGDVIVGTFYTGTNYTGGTFTVHATSPCVGDGRANWFMGSFPDWAQDTHSLQTWANCGIYVYSEENQQGTKDGRFDGNVPDIGPLLGGHVKSASFH